MRLSAVMSCECSKTNSGEPIFCYTHGAEHEAKARQLSLELSTLDTFGDLVTENARLRDEHTVLQKTIAHSVRLLDQKDDLIERVQANYDTLIAISKEERSIIARQMIIIQKQQKKIKQLERTIGK
jgi:hypothetical protein